MGPHVGGAAAGAAAAQEHAQTHQPVIEGVAGVQGQTHAIGELGKKKEARLARLLGFTLKVIFPYFHFLC